jgi:NAD+ kinase
MKKQFQRVLIFGRQREIGNGVAESLQRLLDILLARGVSVTLESVTASYLAPNGCPRIELAELTSQFDLIISVGGDGTLLQAARTAVRLQIPVLGVNRGRLGFLTDVLPQQLEEQVTEVLEGEYFEESRFLLTTTLESTTSGEPGTFLGDALNDVVILPGRVAHMIDFAIYVDNQLVCRQHADGMIVTTPTGSTAYALSGGGPIMHPSLDAVALVPMFPHTLSSRPIVINANQAIRIHIDPNTAASPSLLCDGQERLDVSPGSCLLITKKPQALLLIHPKDYNYYQTLRSKLGWQSKHPND